MKGANNTGGHCSYEIEEYKSGAADRFGDFKKVKHALPAPSKSRHCLLNQVN